MLNVVLGGRRNNEQEASYFIISYAAKDYILCTAKDYIQGTAKDYILPRKRNDFA
jgi:hypothetical protein